MSFRRIGRKKQDSIAFEGREGGKTLRFSLSTESSLGLGLFVLGFSPLEQYPIRTTPPQIVNSRFLCQCPNATIHCRSPMKRVSTFTNSTNLPSNSQKRSLQIPSTKSRDKVLSYLFFVPSSKRKPTSPPPIPYVAVSIFSTSHRSSVEFAENGLVTFTILTNSSLQSAMTTTFF